MEAPRVRTAGGLLRSMGWLSLPAGVFALGCVSTDAPSSSDSSGGRRLYLTCSGSCHSPEPVREFSRDEWERILPEMNEEAKLTAPEAALVRAYVMSHF
jgi:hypothetical protein